MPPDDSFYDVLGVARDAPAEEIQRAYRKLARTYHPDVNKSPEAESTFARISEAYDVLSDPKSRQRYDAFGPDFRRVPDDVDPDAYTRAGARSGGSGWGSRGSRRGGGRRGASTSGRGDVWVDLGEGVGDVDVEDLLGSIFGGRGRAGWGPVAGADQEAELTISIEEAYRGGRRSLTLQGPDGPRTVEVTIPPGVTDGQRIRLGGQGGQGTGGSPPGDLTLVVRLAPHPRFRVQGRDLYVTVPVAPWEAALGGEVPVDTPGGTARIRVPPGTPSGRRLRLKGQGLPARGGGDGDLYAEVRIVVPAEATPAEQELWERLAATSSFDPRRQL
jgi:curved DNA-binding protein